MPVQIDSVRWGFAALLGAAALLLGLASGLNPAVGVAASLALMFALIIVADLAAGLCVFAVIGFAEFLRIGDSALLSGTKIAGLVLALSALAAFTTRPRNRFRTLLGEHRLFVYLAIVLGAWTVLSTQWAENLPAAGLASFGYVIDLALFPIVYAAVRERKHLVWVLAAFVLGAVLSTIQGMLFPTPPSTSLAAEEAAGRLIGAGITPNYLAAILVAGLVLCAGLFTLSARSPLARLAVVAAATICAVGFVLTLSRTGLVALAVCLLAGVVIARRRRATAVVATLLVAATTVAYFGFLGPPEARERVQTLESGSGRLDLWTVGWRMVEDRPGTGVGAGNFREASPSYFRAEPGGLPRSDLILDKGLTAHNTYLEILAELGIPGFVLFVAVVGFALTTAARAAHESFRRGDRHMDALARAVFVAQVGMLVAACFNSIQFIPQLWLLLALGPVLLALSRAPRERDQAMA